MDTTRERSLAAMLGGFGTLAGIAVVEVGIFGRSDFRMPNLVWFMVTVLIIGSIGGAIGHWMFLDVARGGLFRRAFITGSSMGLSIALIVWGVVWRAAPILYPLVPFEEATQLINDSLFHAIVAGPVGGVAASLAVVIQLSRLHVRLPGRAEP